MTYFNKEYEDTKYALDHMPSTIHGKERQNLRTMLNKKLHEHSLASQFPSFYPPPYEQIFINYGTRDLTLIHLIEAVAASKIFTLDTESVLIYKKPNKPSLIQIQIIFPSASSYVIFIEVCHLPRANEHTFELITYFFDALFHPEKTIYIWGNID
ncbi:unnamed protein product, partial [Rotaria sp. Silwood2]